MKTISLPLHLFGISNFSLRPQTQEIIVPFTFRNKEYTCMTYPEHSNDPCYLFILLLDDELIQEFGEDVTILMDGIGALVKKSPVYAELGELQQAIFEAFKRTADYLAVLERWGG